MISSLLTKAATRSLWESAFAGICGKPFTNIPIVKSVKAIPAHPILLAKNMSCPSAGQDGALSVRTQPLADCTAMTNERSTQRPVSASGSALVPGG